MVAELPSKKGIVMCHGLGRWNPEVSLPLCYLESSNDNCGANLI
jgi:hypothetical protein